MIDRTRESSKTVVPDSAIAAQEHVLQASPIELERRHGRKGRRAELDPRRDVGIAVVGKEIAQPELLELSAAQVRLEAENLLKVVGADLDARLADLEGGLAHRMLPLLDHHHAERRRLQIQLPGERRASQAAADDDGIVVRDLMRFIGRGIVDAVRSLRFRVSSRDARVLAVSRCEGRPRKYRTLPGRSAKTFDRLMYETREMSDPQLEMYADSVDLT